MTSSYVNIDILFHNMRLWKYGGEQVDPQSEKNPAWQATEKGEQRRQVSDRAIASSEIT